jgi:hypothetical protein
LGRFGAQHFGAVAGEAYLEIKKKKKHNINTHNKKKKKKTYIFIKEKKNIA